MAFEDAGITRRELDGSKTGVYIGNFDGREYRVTSHSLFIDIQFILRSVGRSVVDRSHIACNNKYKTLIVSMILLPFNGNMTSVGTDQPAHSHTGVC